MKKKLSLVLTLALCVVLIFSLAAVSLAADDEPAPVSALDAEYKFYATNYDWGEEVDSIEFTTAVELDPATVSVEDFKVFSSGWGGENVRTLSNLTVDGKTVKFDTSITGSAVNSNHENTYKIALIGTVADKDGKEYNALNLTYTGIVNPAIDQLGYGKTEHMNYRFFAPENAGDKALPLIVWLHGGGEFGDDNRIHLACAAATNYTKPEIQQIFGGAAYVLYPQSPAPKPHITTNIMETIDDFMAKYNVDSNRIYVMGCSQGGKTTNMLISEYPDFFTAAISDCPWQNQVTEEAAQNLTDFPIIYVHALNDTTAMPYESIESYNHLRAAGDENAWCCLFTEVGTNPVSGGGYFGHFSWVLLHNNFTTNEPNFINGTGVYTAPDGTEYPYVSTPLSEIGKGYPNIMSWLADQNKAGTIEGQFDVYTESHPYGEEATTVVIDTGVEMDAATIAPDDFTISIQAGMCGYTWTTYRTVDSVEVDGSKITLNLVMTGSGNNAPVGDNFKVNLAGYISDAEGNEYGSAEFTLGQQINPEIDQMIEIDHKNEIVQSRLFIPEGAPMGAPLYVWLHGAGEFGSDNRSQVSCSNLTDWLKPEVQEIFGDKGLYVLAIQSQRSPHNATAVMNAILEVTSQYKIDMSRIYIAGCSAGGMGVNTMITAFPNFFAAAAPNCAASVISEAQGATLKDLPVIFVHAANDGTVALSNSIQSYNNMKAAGCDKVWLNFFTGNGNNPVTGQGYDGHWSWIWIHSNYTSTEPEFINGEGTYTNRGREYPYVSTPLSEIDGGYATIANWFAAQQRKNVISVNSPRSDVEVITVQQGDVVRIPVIVSGNQGISSLTLQFSCDQLQFSDEVTPGEAAVRTDALEVNVRNGKVIWTGEATEGLLFYITATVKNPTPDGKYPISTELLAVTGADAQETEATVSEGMLWVVNPHPLGDVNLDGSVNNADLIMIARYLIDLVQFDDEQLEKADFDENGEINNTDLVKIARYLVGE